MKTDSLDRRLEDLERQHEEQPKIRMRWYDDPGPTDRNVTCFQRR
jgi:hypothetical protein